MQQFVTLAIVLSRVEFGEADRIVTILTPERGKLAVIAKGVRREKSKLAGGIELFSVSELSIIKGRGEVDTLTSSRLQVHYGNIVKDIARTGQAYDCLKIMSKISGNAYDKEYFGLLKGVLTALDVLDIPLDVVALWFDVQLLRILGHAPNLHTDQNGKKLSGKGKYIFDLERMCLALDPDGILTPDHIKFMRLVQSNNPAVLYRVSHAQKYSADWLPLAKSMISLYANV